jgi:hypothetical protein
MIDRDEGPRSQDGRTAVASGRSGERRWWRVGADRVELWPSGPGWGAGVRRAGWGGVPLEVDRLFAGEPEALAWCRRMAEVMARDVDDETGGLKG